MQKHTHTRKRQCRRCGTEFQWENKGRGSWPRFCSAACKEAKPAHAPVMPECTVAGCDTPARSSRGPYCEKHYHRMRRTGTTDVANPQREARGVCAVDDCHLTDCGPHGLCPKHLTRLRRHGDPSIRLAPARLGGDLHPQWKADGVGYGGAHERVKAIHGSATKRTCVNCGGQADHWSYNHGSEREQYADDGRPFSPDPEDYSARCVSCHKVYDLSR